MSGSSSLVNVTFTKLSDTTVPPRAHVLWYTVFGLIYLRFAYIVN